MKKKAYALLKDFIVVLLALTLMAFLLVAAASCASYPNQSKVIKPTHNVKATFR